MLSIAPLRKHPASATRCILSLLRQDITSRTYGKYTFHKQHPSLFRPFEKSSPLTSFTPSCTSTVKSTPILPHSTYRTSQYPLAAKSPPSAEPSLKSEKDSPNRTFESKRAALGSGEVHEGETKASVVFRQLGNYLWPSDPGLRARVVLSMVVLLGGKVLGVYVPFLFKEAVDTLNVDVETVSNALVSAPIAILLGYGVARATSSLFNELRGVLFAKVMQNGINDMSNRTLTHLLSLDWSFHQHRDTGALLQSINRGSQAINNVLNALAFNVIPTLAEIILVLSIFCTQFSPMFGGVAVLTLASYIGFTVVVTQWRSRFRKELNRDENRASSICYDALLNYETVKFFTNERMEQARYAKILDKMTVNATKIQTSLSLLNFGQFAIFSMGLTAIMILTAKGIMAHQYTVGDLVMANGLLFQLSIPLNFVGTVYRSLHQSVIDLQTMLKLQQEPSQIVEQPNAIELNCAPGSGEIKFENVSFSYGDRSILKNCSFTIHPGQSIAIVGESGSGKSTLLRLLYRFVDPSEGRITIDGHDIRSVTLDSLRRTIGVVPQETSLFNDTLRYNIAYGSPNASDEDLVRAAKLARIHTSIERMPKKYDSIVGERGFKLSGGEKQRVSIARMILKSPSIIFCDEATSALDSHTEQELLQNLRDVSEGRTTVVIAHRLSTIVDSDVILVLHEGHVIESGSHDSLLATPGSRYGHLWSLQANIEEAEVADADAVTETKTKTSVKSTADATK